MPKWLNNTLIETGFRMIEGNITITNALNDPKHGKVPIIEFAVNPSKHRFAQADSKHSLPDYEITIQFPLHNARGLINRLETAIEIAHGKGAKGGIDSG